MFIYLITVRKQFTFFLTELKISRRLRNDLILGGIYGLFKSGADGFKQFSRSISVDVVTFFDLIDDLKFDQPILTDS